jgi:hypothetical protein
MKTAFDSKTEKRIQRAAEADDPSREAANKEAASRALARINRIAWKLGVRIRGARRCSR